ncbi:hypothetical protein XI04_27565 [Bradyrhizobium sp. CCBAU 11430]|nr:hypothetical protein [Bradyrhizobium sp. CCBAU 25360]MDA9516772.1 hypothetical protein [Bradyrhizobium sp. CCBAU 11430]
MIGRHVDMKILIKMDAATFRSWFIDAARIVGVVLNIISKAVVDEAFEVGRIVVAVFRLTGPYEIDTEIDVELFI